VLRSERSTERLRELRFRWVLFRHRAWSSVSASMPWARDPLCGLPMTRLWRRRIRLLLAQRRRFALVIFDVDRLKTINLHSSISAGDRALKEIAFELRRALPKQGRLYRVGGDEFAALLPGLNENEAYAWAETARKAVESNVVVVVNEHGAQAATIRAGVTAHTPTKRLWSQKHETLVIIAADDALTEARKQGGNRAVARSA
jgi:diguanylate cyclase (GGDEF)-like protein